MRGGSKPRYTESEFVAEVIALYQALSSVKRVAEEMLISTVGVKNILKRKGVALKRRRWADTACMDCGKPTTGLRCAYHRKIRNAQSNRMAARRYKDIPEERWIIPDEPIQKLPQEIVDEIREKHDAGGGLDC